MGCTYVCYFPAAHIKMEKNAAPVSAVLCGILMSGILQGSAIIIGYSL